MAVNTVGSKVFQLVHGQVISCNISGHEIERAFVSRQNGQVYIHQNITHGSHAPEMHGYTCSWSVGSGDKRGCHGNSVTNIKVLAKTIEDCGVGDCLDHPEGVFVEVLADLGKVVMLSAMSNCYHAGSWYTRQELIDKGFKMRLPEPVIEVTVLKDGIPCKEPITEAKAKELGIIA